MGNLKTAAQALAQSILAGPWTYDAVQDRARRALGGGPPAPDALAERLLQRLGDHHAPHPRLLERAILEDLGLTAAWAARQGRDIPIRHLLDSPVMERRPRGLAVAIPDIPTTGDLARWLGVTAGELIWLSDPWGRQCQVQDEALRHYRYQWREREDRPPRLIEMPKPRLKRIQRRLLRQVLDRVPPHAAVHGFRAGRSCLSFAEPHLGRPVVVRMDLEDFFQSIPAHRITAVFRSLGYPLAVARALGGLCVHGVSSAFLHRRAPALPWERRNRLATPHLPQGAPTSPALANLCTYHLDCRLAGLARSLGLAYTRYADDLAFSGPATLARGFERFHVLVARIALEEGYALNTRKTRLMHQSQCQRLAGIVVNQRPNPARTEYDRLKAILHNCLRIGPADQNRVGVADFRAYLLGRVAHVSQLNPRRGARLRALWERIDWERQVSLR